MKLQEVIFKLFSMGYVVLTLQEFHDLSEKANGKTEIEVESESDDEKCEVSGCNENPDKHDHCDCCGDVIMTDA